MSNVSWSTGKHEDYAYECGHCGRSVGGHVLAAGSITLQSYPFSDEEIALATACPVCGLPSSHILHPTRPMQHPPVLVGRDVDHLPDTVGHAYTSARRAISAGSFDGAALVLRNLIAHMAVELGADAGGTYKGYVDWLVEHRHTPPGADDIVDSLRDLGNETAHELIQVDRDEVLDALQVAETLLRFRFEAPESVKRRRASRGR